VSKKVADQSTAIEDFVLSQIKTANCISKVAAEIAFQLPLAELPNFKDLFLGLDAKMNEFNIASYGISITTLEEVFLKVAEGSALGTNGLKIMKEDPDNDKIDDFDLNAVKIKGKLALFFVHFWALFLKRMQYFKRDKKGLCCEILLPCAVVGIGLCITFITFFYEAPALIMSGQILNKPIEFPIQQPYASGFYTPTNFPGSYYNFLSNPYINNNDLLSFDQYAFQERNIDTAGLYGAAFIKSIQNNQISYVGFVRISLFLIC
jgi:ATP-binding cassette subfamily A (ABC1) protein 3